MKRRIAIALVAICGGFGISLRAQDPGKTDDMRNCPMHGRHDPSDPHAAMLEHGDKVMGFSWQWDGKSSKHIPFDWSGPDA